jgi:hypothetical protein
MNTPRTALLSTLLTAGLALASASAEGVDWSRQAGVEEVTVITRDADGDERETTIWLIVVDGQGYIRTGSTRWGDDVERDPDLVLRIDETELPLRAEFVTDEPLREKIEAAFREKYGFMDRVIDVFRGSEPRIMRLLPRS